MLHYFEIILPKSEEFCRKKVTKHAEGVGKTRDGRISVTVKMGKTRDGAVSDIYVTDP